MKFKFLSVGVNVRDYVPEGHEFAGVTPIYYSPFDFLASKFILSKNIETQEVFKYAKINEEHPLWDYQNSTI